MNAYEDTLRQITSWRTYRRMLADDARYVRLVADLALVIRSRLR